MNEILIEIKNLSFSFDKHIVLDNISLTIFKNEIIAIIGPNGGGKTTLLKLILGLYKPKSGIIIKKDNLKFGYLPQKANYIDFPISVEDFILLARYRGLFKKFDPRDNEKLFEVLNLLNIENLAKKRLKNLSGGELQKVLLARALVNDPSILILDEPTSFIDFKGQSEFYELLERLQKRMSIIFVSHDLGVLSKKIKRIICLNRVINFDGNLDKNMEKIMNKMYGFELNIIDHKDHKIL